MRKIHKGDHVIVLTGEFKGKEGTVLNVDPEKNRAVVEGVNFVKRHQKPTQKNPQGGIVEKEAPVHMSNLMVICGKCNAGSRTKVVTLQNGEKARVCKRCDEILTTKS
jgi:large subunit ribosomal protein L24